MKLLVSVLASLVLAACSSGSAVDTQNSSSPEVAAASVDFATAGTTKAVAHSFLQQLQQAVAANNKAAVASLVHYPLRINRARVDKHDANDIHTKHTLLIMNSSAFIRQYQRIITPTVKRAILKQLPETLFVNSQGVMLGGGQVWLYPKSQDSVEPLQIIVVNQ